MSVPKSTYLLILPKTSETSLLTIEFNNANFSSFDSNAKISKTSWVSNLLLEYAKT